MKLQTRLSLAFLVASWLPIGAVTLFLLFHSADQFERSFADRAGAIERTVEERLAAIAAELDRALGKIAEDPVLEKQLLEPLARGVFYDNREVDYERVIVREARRLMTSAVLDTLRVVDLGRRGHVVAMGHRTGVEAADAEILQLIEKHVAAAPAPSPNIRLFRYERVENLASGRTEEVWTLQVVRVVTFVGGADGAGAARVALVGGKTVDRRLIDDLRMVAGPGTEIALDDGGGRRVAASFAGARPAESPGGYASRERELPNAGVARLRVWVPRAELVAGREELIVTAAFAVGGSLIFAMLAGYWLARRVSRPLVALANAATDVAAGARDRELPLPRGAREVRELTEAFNIMISDVAKFEQQLRQSERVAAWRDIARRIAHEIKNPLSPIQMAIETLKRVWDRKHPDFDQIFRESTATILEEVARMTRIVSEFSDFARMPAPKPQRIELVELANQVLTLLHETAPEVEVTLASNGPVHAELDPDQLRQVLINLIKNGFEALTGEKRGAAVGAGPSAASSPVKAGPPRLEVRVENEVAGAGAARIVVTDDGPGMSPEAQKKLFTPYFTTKQQGTGLGLPIVQRIVAEHGGTITVDSTPGVGTRFVLRFPRRTA